jgi:hypothetical protein
MDRGAREAVGATAGGDDGEPRGALSRRSLFRGAGAATVASIAVGSGGLQLALPAIAQAAEATSTPLTPAQLRQRAARRTRMNAADLAYARPLPVVVTNNEEGDYGGTRIGNFSKGLPHNNLGEVDPNAYNALLAATASGAPKDFEAIPLAGVRRLTSPLSGMAFDLEGPDCQSVGMRPVPRLDSAEGAGEAAELYWMALARDVPFSDYATNPVTTAAATDLSKFSDFRGPKQGGAVRPPTLFRGNTAGDANGPYVSQFLLRDIPYGALTVSQKLTTVLPNIDYLTTYSSWLSSRNGASPPSGAAFDGTPRHIRNGRDLTRYVHVDALYEAYLNACLILLGMGAPVDAGNPYVSFHKQDSFATFGGPHVLSLVTEVATRALKGVWYCKWFVHRRARPEEIGGVVHNRRTNAATYPVHAELLNSPVLDQVSSRFHSYLLPQAFPEGAPLHPSYGSGHATVAGACVTVLKAWFDESWVIPNPVVASADGTALVAYSGPPLTVGGELNKVAANIASGRNFAGIHWRTDFTEGVKLGEAIALGILQEQAATYAEQAHFSLTKFDGTTITV